jgi:hypothetical protein
VQFGGKVATFLKTCCLHLQGRRISHFGKAVSHIDKGGLEMRCSEPVKAVYNAEEDRTVESAGLVDRKRGRK